MRPSLFSRVCSQLHPTSTMKRHSVVTTLSWFIVVFIIWNFVAYFLFGRTNKPNDAMVQSSRDLSERLGRLQERLKGQMQINQELLLEIDQQKQLHNERVANRQKEQDAHAHDMQEQQQQPPQHPAEEQLVDGANDAEKQDGGQGPGQSEAVRTNYPFLTYKIPILLIACNRPSAVTRSLNSLIANRPSAEQFPIYVSQDCGDKKTADAIQMFGSKVVHMKQPDLSPIANLPTNQKKFEGYYKISRHYKWALDQMFVQNQFDATIVVEDDLDVAIDFFEYFLATYPLLKEDPTLWCVSAWNDNGRDTRIEKNPGLLYRSDFFPGLGWMLLREEWLDLRGKWPAGFWDDWMRHPDQRRDRACIRPEMSRTDTFGKFGVSKGQFFEQHLKFISLNKEFYPFTAKDLSYLLKKNYDTSFRERVYGAESRALNDIKGGPSEIRITYTDKNSFKTITKTLGIMQDFKAGVPRTGYLGIVPCMYNGQRIYIAPDKSWTGYDINWS